MALGEGPPPQGQGALIGVLLVIGSLDRGGAELQLLGLARRLDRRTFAPRIVCLTHAGTEHAAAAAAGIAVDVLAPPDGTRLPWAHWIEGLVRLARQWKIGVVHGFIFPTYSLTAIAAVLAGARSIAGVRSLGLGPEQRFPLSLLERFGNRLTDCAVANSEAVRRSLIDRDPGVAARCRVIYNGVGLPTASPEPWQSPARKTLGLNTKHLAITVIANFHPYKGHRHVLDAHAALLKTHPHARLLFAGHGHEENNLRCRASALGVAESVHFLGSTTEIESLLDASDVVVHASSQEGFPNATLQAMAMGRPVIATRVGGIPEQVVDGTTGLLVDPGHTAGIVSALQRLAEDETLRLSLGAAGRARARDVFSWERMTAAYAGLYTEMAEASA